MAKSGFATLADLSGLLGVSASTARRDLIALEAAGIVQRVHGGVVLAGAGNSREGNGAEQDTVLDISLCRPGQSLGEDSRLAQAKRAIARVAADLVEDGDTILLDGGTTTYALAQALVGRRLQVITNSIPVANLFVHTRQADVVLLGGVVNSRSGVALGPTAVAMLDDLNCRRAFLSAAGINAQGLYNSNLLLVETERAMIRCAECVTVVADSSKFGRKSLSHLCDLQQIDELIVDDHLETARWSQLLEQAGVRVYLAPTLSGANSPEPNPSEPISEGSAADAANAADDRRN